MHLFEQLLLKIFLKHLNSYVGKILIDFLLFLNLGFSQNLGFGLEREHSHRQVKGHANFALNVLNGQELFSWVEKKV